MAEAANTNVTSFFTSNLINKDHDARVNASAYVNKDGFDLVWSQSQLQGQMDSVFLSIKELEANANLSDTEKMFFMQMAMNTWSAIANLRTNMLKSISDTLKTVCRNVV